MWKGGCACGAVRYETKGEPAFALHCHCRQCQRITGAGHASQFAAAADGLMLSGDVKYFDLVADSGNKVRSGFCPRCGSPMLKTSAGYPQFVFIHAATLDDPSAFAPSKAVWLRSRQPWDHLDPSLEAV